MSRVVIFSSGAGTNAENIIRSLRGVRGIVFPFVLSNRGDSLVHERARRLGVPSYSFSRAQFEDGTVLSFLLGSGIDFIVLAGFLLKIPVGLLQAYPDRIINIHPSLLPKFGGLGMYGMRVHEAVVMSGERESGITIHYVNERYDEGRIIFSAKCDILPGDTAEDVSRKVHALEYAHYPKVIERLVGL
ncbi:MAG: phosphoribosylglycinamide formyltransferase [Dysgonamonadaceae bacterium]|jgi:phosphoribosylglycinamide formyltransferase-1|nr:phosphoribosylglycinamide formyltransferase [Dysgonamonadaceae bacterium]